MTKRNGDSLDKMLASFVDRDANPGLVVAPILDAHAIELGGPTV
jgi:hypothetical protein